MRVLLFLFLALLIAIVVAVAVAVWVNGDRSDGRLPNDTGFSIGSGSEGSRVETSTGPQESRQPIGTSSRDETLEVVAVRFGTSARIEGAEVGWFDFPGDRSRLSDADMERLRRDPMEFCKQRGRLGVTNDRGSCRIPKLASTTVLVVLQFEHLFGRVYLLPRQTGPVIAVLRPDHDIVVTVLGADGRRATGIDVVMSNPRDPSKRKMLGKTDTDGKVVHYHCQADGDQEASIASFTAVGIGMVSDPVEVDTLSKPTVEVVLRLPPSGTITFQLQSKLGAPYDLRGHSLPMLSCTMTGRDHGSGESIQGHRFDSSGGVVLRNVALGMSYSVRVTGYLSRPVVGRGPTRESPHVVVPLVVQDSIVTLRGRALDVAGEPIANTKINIDIRWDGGRVFSGYSTDAEGMFLVAGSFLIVGQRIDVTASILGRNRSDLPEHRTNRGSAANLTCLIASGFVVAPGTNDVGDVTLGESALLLTGRLVVPATLESTERIGWAVERESPSGHRWSTASDCTTKWMQGRRFEVRGYTSTGQKLRLRFARGSFLPMEPLEFAAGTRGIELRIRVGGTLIATLLVREDRGRPPELDARLRLADPPERLEMSERERRGKLVVSDDQELAGGGGTRMQSGWHGLVPGVYGLTICVSETGEPVVAVDGIVVGEGQVDDNRLRDVDLRDKMRPIRISVVDQRGEFVEDADARILLADADSQNWETRTLSGGRLRLNVVSGVDLRVLVSGYRLASRNGVAADLVIRLESAPRLRLEVNWPSDHPRGISPVVRLTPRDRETVVDGHSKVPGQAARPTSDAYVEGSVDANGLVIVRPFVHGPHSISMVMVPGGERHYALTTPRTIEVTGEEVGAVVLDVDKERLRDAIGQMRRR